MNTTLEPFGRKILVRQVDEETKTKTGLIIANVPDQPKLYKASVLAVSREIAEEQNGIRPGDTLLVSSLEGWEWRDEDGRNVRVVNADSAVICRIRPK